MRLVTSRMLAPRWRSSNLQEEQSKYTSMIFLTHESQSVTVFTSVRALDGPTGSHKLKTQTFKPSVFTSVRSFSDVTVCHTVSLTVFESLKLYNRGSLVTPSMNPVSERWAKTLKKVDYFQSKKRAPINRAAAPLMEEASPSQILRCVSPKESTRFPFHTQKKSKTGSETW